MSYLHYIILHNVTKKKNRQNGMGKSLTTVAKYKEIRVSLIDINKDKFSPPSARWH